MDEARAKHFTLRGGELDGVAFTITAGCRGAPRPPAAWASLLARAAELRGEVLDASGLFGLPGRAVRTGRVSVYEPSAAGLAAIRTDGADEVLAVRAGLPWDAPPGRYDHVLLAPPADRGNARVRAEISAAARALKPGGTAWLGLERDRGAKRYEREATAAIGPGEVVARKKGFRVSRFRCERTAPTELDPWLRFDTPRGPAMALAGTFAAGKLDPGTARLLDALDRHAADRTRSDVLDLGCGWGPLARWAAAGGGRVTACDDDLAAVRSTARNVPGARVVHSDLDLELSREDRFDLVLLNPAFHLGAGVRVGLGAAMVETAIRRVRRGGDVWMVANEDLPYDAVIEAAGGEATRVARAGGFRVSRVRRRSGR